MSKKSIIIVFTALMLFFGCSGGKDEEVVRIKDVQLKEGIPVEVSKISRETLVISKRYSGTLRGKEEAMVSAPIGGNIEKILVKIGQYVNKNDVIAQYREDASASQYIQAKAAFDNSIENLKRLESLFETGAISQQNLDNARTGHAVTKANYAAATKQIFVIAPISGYVGDIFLNEGDGVGPEAPILTITDLKDLTMEIDIPQSDIANISKETTVKIFPTNGYEKAFEGEISRISLTASPMTRNFQVDIAIANPEKMLRSGVIAEVELNLVEKEETVYIQRENIIVQNDEEFVYVVEKGNAKLRKIKTGLQSGLVVEVLEGLNPIDVLVVSGQTLLTDGAKVKIIGRTKEEKTAAKFSETKEQPDSAKTAETGV